MEGLEDPGGAPILAQKLIAAFADPLEIGGQPLRIEASIGITLVGTDGTDTTAAVVKRADEAMYAAKLAAKTDTGFTSQQATT